MEAMNSQGATRSQVFMGTWNVSKAATKPITKAITWRSKKCSGAILPKRGLSGRAIEAEYTMTTPQASSATTTHSRVWSKPSTRAGVALVWRYSMPPMRTGRRSAALARKPSDQPLKRCHKVAEEASAVLRPISPPPDSGRAHGPAPVRHQ